MRVNLGRQMISEIHMREQTSWLKQMRACTVMLLSILLLLPYAFAQAQDVGVRAELSASSITRDESVILTISAIGLDEALDSSSLERDFEVVGRSSSREVRMTMGSDRQARNTSIVSWQLELLPKGVGVFTVPAVKVGDFETQLMTLTVNELPQGAQRDVFLEARVDTTEPWVQSQVLMSLLVYQAVDIVDGGLEIPSGENLFVEPIGEDTQSLKTVDGRQYSVLERRFALFPQKSGVITIDPVTLSVKVPANPDRVRGLFSPTRKLTRRTDPIVLNVKARPASASGAQWWLPARQLQLQSDWQSEPQSAQVDQPLTRTITMRVNGVQQAQLPQLSTPDVAGVSLYADDPTLLMQSDASGLISEQRINWALIPQRSGELTLPEISVEWFNTLTGQTETAILPAETINIAPSSSTLPAATAPGDGQSNSVSGLDGSDSSMLALADTDEQGLHNNLQQGLQDNGSVAGNLAAAGLQRQISSLQSSLQLWRTVALGSLAVLLLAGLFWGFKHRIRAWRAGRSGEAPSPDKPATNLSVKSSVVSDLYNKFAPMNQLEKACEQGDLSAIKSAVIDWAGKQWPEDAPTTLYKLNSHLPDSAASTLLSRLQAALYSESAYLREMPALAEELAGLPDALKTALTSSDSTDQNLVSRKVSAGVSRLPQL